MSECLSKSDGQRFLLGLNVIVERNTVKYIHDDADLSFFSNLSGLVRDVAFSFFSTYNSDRFDFLLPLSTCGTDRINEQRKILLQCSKKNG